MPIRWGAGAWHWGSEVIKQIHAKLIALSAPLTAVPKTSFLRPESS